MGKRVHKNLNPQKKVSSKSFTDNSSLIQTDLIILLRGTLYLSCPATLERHRKQELETDGYNKLGLTHEFTNTLQKPIIFLTD